MQATEVYTNSPSRKRSSKRQTVKVTLWVKPVVKAEVQRIAERERLSLSATGAAFLERAVQERVDMEYGALLQPVIEATITKAMNHLTNNLSRFLGRSVYDAGQMRWLFINTLYREVVHPQKQFTKEEFYTLLDTSRTETLKRIRQWNDTQAEATSAIKKQLI